MWMESSAEQTVGVQYGVFLLKPQQPCPLYTARLSLLQHLVG